MEQYECKRLDLDALHLVYREHLTPDFPPAERKPLSAMEKLLSAGRYEPWGLYRGEELMAYALLWRDPEGGFVLLDYLGVCRDKPRGQGIGTVMVAHLMGQYRHVSGILVEAEAEGDDASNNSPAPGQAAGLLPPPGVPGVGLCGAYFRRAVRHAPVRGPDRGGGHGGPPAALPL